MVRNHLTLYAPTNCLSVFDHFVGWRLKRLKHLLRILLTPQNFIKDKLEYSFMQVCFSILFYLLFFRIIKLRKIEDLVYNNLQISV